MIHVRVHLHGGPAAGHNLLVLDDWRAFVLDDDGAALRVNPGPHTYVRESDEGPGSRCFEWRET